MRLSVALLLGVFGVSAGASRYAAAQANPAYYPGGSGMASSGVRTASYQQTTGVNNPALNFYGGSKSLAYVPQSHTAAPNQVQVQTAPGAKPFAGVQQGSNVTPYLALDYTENPT